MDVDSKICHLNIGETEIIQGKLKYNLLVSILKESKILQMYTQITEVSNTCPMKKLDLIKTNDVIDN